MGKYLLFSFVLIIGLLLGALYVTKNTTQGMQLRQAVDYGVLTSREDVQHVFSLRNYSLSVWEPKETKSSCGCTVVESIASSVKPFAKLDVPVRVNLKGKNGPFESTVKVSFADGQVVELVLKGEYYPNLPTSIEVGKVQRGAACGTFYLPARDTGNRTVAVDTGDSAVLEGRVTKSEIAGVLVSFTTRPDAPSGDFESLARLTGGAQDAPLQIKISGRIAADVEADSEVVSFGYAEQDASDTNSFATAQFYSPYKVRFSFDPAASTVPHGFAIDSVTEGENGLTKISVKVDGHSLPLGLYSEKALFAFSFGADTVTVPVALYGYVLPRLAPEG